MSIANETFETSKTALNNPAALKDKALAEDLAPFLLQEALSPVAQDLDTLNQKIIAYIPSNTATTDQVLQHIFAAGGKRIRPAFYFFCCKLFNYQGDHYYPIAAVCEFVHTASLLHDDVVDNSPLRRNKPTANRIWGDQASVLVGDLIYSRASEMMAATGSLEIVESFARAIRLMSEGELFQLEQVFDLDTTEETYFKILNFKTAVLISTSCAAAAILADASRQEITALQNFGSSIGIAFQLVDDALDYLGSRELFGKQTLSDLREGKVTMPVLLLNQKASAEELAHLRAILDKDKIENTDVEVVSKLVEKYKTAEITIDKANEYTDRALSELKIFPESPARTDLENLAKRLVWRFN